ncbi:hypothetical protein BDV98DRAFT_627232, partial [Pterulicium gracile]
MNIGCVVVTSEMVLITRKTRADRAEKAGPAFALILYCTLLMMAYPTFSIAPSTLLLASG